jgi:hypothetical protein
MKLISKTLLALAIAIPAAGCGGGMSKEDSLRGWTAANLALSTAFSSAQTSGQTLRADAATTLNATVNCMGGGTIAVTGSVDNSGTSQTIDVTEKATGCKSSDITFDGNMTYKTVVNGSAVDFKWVGTLKFSGAVSGDCDIDVTIKASGSSGSFEGSICGNSFSGTAG